MNIRVDCEWRETLQQVRQRWPKWEASEMDVEDWGRALKNRHPEDVREALYRVRSKYASDSPKLAWVIRAANTVRDEREANVDMENESIAMKTAAAKEMMEEAEYQGQHEARIQRLAHVDPERVSMVRRLLEQKGFIQRHAESDPNKWPRFTVGLVMAAIDSGWPQLEKPMIEKT